MIMPRMIATDLDGTALYDGVHMSQRTIEVFRRAEQAGICLVIATGRSVVYLREMELPHFPYAVVNNGVAVVDMDTGKAIYKDYFTPEEAITAWEIIKPYHPYFELAIENDVVIDRKSFEIYGKLTPPLYPHMVKYIREGKMTVVDDMDAFLRSHASVIEKMTILRTAPEVKQAIQQGLDETGLFQTKAALPTDVMAIPKRTNKGKALVDFAERLGIRREEVYAFGDAGNDLQMLESAGCGIAMGNAPDFVKQRADMVCGTVYEDGLAAFLEDNFGI